MTHVVPEEPKRRKFLLSAGLLLVVPFAFGQPVRRPVRIAILDEAGQGSQAEHWRAFLDQLQKLGYSEGKNLVIDSRFSQGVSARLSAHAAELVALKPDLLVASTTLATQAAMKVTRSIPIVFVGAADPVKSGLVAALARPGGNVTGQSILQEQLNSKRLEMLLEAAPGLKKIAFLGQTSNHLHTQAVQSLQDTWRSGGLEFRLLEASTPDAIARAFGIMVRDRFSAFLVAAGLVPFAHRQEIIALAARHKLPAIYPREGYVEAGGLLSYSGDVFAVYRRAAYYAHQILQGAKPSELPVEQAAIFRTGVNVATARALGIKMPQSILLRADRVIE